MVWFLLYFDVFFWVGILLDGILEVSIIQMTDVVMPVPQPDKSLVDFVVTCQGM